MKKSLLAIALTSLCLSGAVLANDTAEQVNYGDPTASYRGLGIQGSDDAYQAVGVFGFGEHIASFDLGKNTKTDSLDYRARYFNVDKDSGFGWSVDVLGSKGDKANSNGLMAGLVQKIQVTDNIIMVPMLAAGKVSGEDKTLNAKSSSWVAQPGLYAMYAFDAGHWLYANPKSTYVHDAKSWSAELELGGGYMTSDNTSVGFKYETSRFKGATDSKGWLNAYFYF
ncbi:hypothetical protein [Vibrio sp. HN007]|uniref:hypothetical protein n=1 Tax=Vibrio iocasae TaxID=3098914 RepID=UPI0035D44D88